MYTFDMLSYRALFFAYKINFRKKYMYPRAEVLQLFLIVQYSFIIGKKSIYSPFGQDHGLGLAHATRRVDTSHLISYFLFKKKQRLDLRLA